MPDADLQSEEFMVLLTDALRSGPGSPEWHQAVRVLRSSNQNVDEYTLLYNARENLEAGKSYRTVRAGPNFTKKVLDRLDEKGGQPRTGLPTTTVLGLLAAVVIVGVIAVVTWLATRGGGGKQTAIDDLNNLVFSNTIVKSNFTGAALPVEWRKIGDLPLTVSAGLLRPGNMAPATTSAVTTSSTREYKVGGIVTPSSLPAETPVEIDVVLRVARAADDGVAQVFITDTPIDDDHANNVHELVWLFQGGQAKVFLPSGRAEGAPEKVAAGRDLPVKLIVNRELVLVESGGKRLYAGPHQLSPTQPRYVGVRFLRKNGEKWDHLGFVSIAVLKQ